MNLRALLKYICALLLFGLNGIVASQISLSSYEIVFLRTLIGSLFLILLFLVFRNRFHIRDHFKDFMFVVISGISMGASWMFLYEAYQQIGISFSSLLYYCGPVIVMILSPLIFKEKMTASKIVGFLAVLAGIVLVNGNAAQSNFNRWGVFCGAMSALMYFLMVTFNKKSTGIIGMENAVIQLAVSFLTSAIFVLIKGGCAIAPEWSDWKWILLLGIVNTGIGCYLYFSPLSELPVQTVAVCGYLEPLSAVFFAMLILGERMTVLQIVGAVLILGGALFGELAQRHAQTA